MQLALHAVWQLPHLVHATELIFILNSENFDTNPKKEPTGQILLQ